MNTWMKLLLLVTTVVIAGCEVEDRQDNASALDLLRVDEGSFAKAIDKRSFSFPADHGAHPEFRSEWWYLTGNLVADADRATTRESGRSFGFQITLFRFALPVARDGGGPWHADQLWVAQFALTDITRQRFFTGDRSARQAVGLAGAQENGSRIWVEDVVIEGLDGERIRIVARNTAFGLDLALETMTPIVLNGDGGLSQKGSAKGNASYYYAIPRLRASGSIQMDGEHIPVTGAAWLDREWSTSALDDNQEGWDWFALHLDDGRNLMVYRLRNIDGSTANHSSLTLSDGSGVIEKKDVSDANMHPREYWTSPATGSRYPVRWTLNLERGKLDVRAVMNNQEHPEFLRYWEGAVTFSGSLDGHAVNGTGYLEMTGY